MNRFLICITCLALSLSAVGCGEDESNESDQTPTDVAGDVGDGGVDTPGDASDTDPGDGLIDTQTDTAVDTPGDTPADASQDVAPDVPGTREWRYVGAGSWGGRAWTSDGINWTDIGNPPQMDDHTPDLLRDIAWGNGVFIAVGGDRNSMVMRSTDGATWNEDLHPAGTQWLGGVAYGNSVWVAGGGVGTNMRSLDDGLTWTPNDNRTGNAIRNIAYADDKFIAVGDNGMIAVSSDDGQTWTEQTQGTVGLGGVGYGLGVWVVTGSSWNGGGFDVSCFVSPDAITWTACPFTSGRLGGVLFDGTQLLVDSESGHIATTNGADWTEVMSEYRGNMVYGDGRYVGGSDSRRYVSTDLTNWTSNMFDRGFRSMAAGWVDLP